MPHLLEWIEDRMDRGLPVDQDTLVWAYEGFAQGMVSGVSSILGTLLF
jgi:hypothetical protein